ncbi:glucosaminidase domain-containing protein [Kutzneria sp. CA-103260]|uniref:glucosaminidase domain-containing protein n=1 Tax=Kutzneria sp. CA-103260 TaxID=2802641 RepID=UPI001BA96981|nr:glucosaminidase domain-containing protein [Kutzneria sp. CA-103260]QUQ63252.1 Mannosyl-glycoprotein endo-beta-N-acetylglucosaminidase [Kutzneria sp. CA-103260]
MNGISSARRFGVAALTALGVVLAGVNQVDAVAAASGQSSIADAVKAGAIHPDTTQTHDDFINAAGPAAQRSQTDYGVPASVTVAQAIVESAWGSAAPNNNYFGIKCSGGDHGPIANGCADLPTTECTPDCHTVIASFRTYASMTDSFRDHGLFLRTNSRYNNAFSYTNNADQFVQEIAAAGYATDPNYASTVISIMQSNNLYRFNTISNPFSSYAVYRPSNASFYVRKDSDGSVLTQQAFGAQGDVPLAGHFQDSAYDNLAVWRPSDASFYIRAADGTLLTQVFFGQTGDLPLVGHFENSNYDNLAVYRPSNSTFYIRKSDGSLLTQVVFGASGDIPVVGHFEDSAYDNLAVYRPSNSTFYIRKSDGSLLTQVVFGAQGDIPMVGHFENSGYDNLGVYRPSNSSYYIRKSDGSLLTQVFFGASGDLPVVGHFE